MKEPSKESLLTALNEIKSLLKRTVGGDDRGETWASDLDEIEIIVDRILPQEAP